MSDEAFLAHLTATSAGRLCTHPRDDLRRLIGMAGFGPETLTWQDVAGEGGSIEVRSEGVRQLVKMVRESDRE